MPELIVQLGDITNNPDITFAQGRDMVIHRLQESDWLKHAPEHELIHSYLEELGKTTDTMSFAYVWNSILDEATYARVLISTQIITKG